MLRDVINCHEMHSMLIVSVTVVHRFRFIYVNPQMLGETLDVVLEVSALLCDTARFFFQTHQNSKIISTL